MSWTAFHSRGETLRTVVDTANARRDGVLPRQVPGVAENFTDEIDLVGALLLKWHARLSGNIERALSREPMDLEGAVVHAWRSTVDQMPGVRLVIDRCADSPDDRMATAMARAREREWLRLAAAAGLANDQGAAAAEAGRRVEERARGGRERAPDTRTVSLTETPASSKSGERAEVADDSRTESFVDRIKAVLAA